MNDESRDPIWLPPLSLVVIGLLVGLLFFATPQSFRITGQALGLILVLRAFCYWPPLVRWIASMPVPHRLVLGIVVGGMMLGHYTLDNRTYFPFVAWEIFPFVKERDPVTCREFIATTASGKQVRLLAEQLIPSIVQLGPMEDLDDPKLYPPGTTERLARILARAYNRSHADDPVRQVELDLMAVPLHPPANEAHALPSCQHLQRYDISSAP